MPDQIGRSGKEHTAFLLGRFHAQRDRQVRFPGADRPGEDQILGRGDPFPACEGVDLCGADALDRREIKRIKGFDLGKPRLAESLADHRLVPGGLLGAEHLLQVVFVRPVRIARLAGEPFEHARHARQLEGARVRDDEIAGEGGGSHTASASH